MGLVYGLPITALNAGWIEPSERFVLWSGVAVLVAVWCRVQRRDPEELGFSRRGLPAALAAHAGFALFMLVWIALFSTVGLGRSSRIHLFERAELREHLPWLFFALYPPWVLGQELVFRGALFAEARAAGIRAASVPALLSAALYCASFWSVDGRYAFCAAVAGFFWALLFAKYRNLWAGVIAHTVVGWAALLARLP